MNHRHYADRMHHCVIVVRRALVREGKKTTNRRRPRSEFYADVLIKQSVKHDLDPLTVDMVLHGLTTKRTLNELNIIDYD